MKTTIERTTTRTTEQFRVFDFLLFFFFIFLLGRERDKHECYYLKDEKGHLFEGGEKGRYTVRRERRFSSCNEYLFLLHVIPPRRTEIFRRCYLVSHLEVCVAFYETPAVQRNVRSGHA